MDDELHSEENVNSSNDGSNPQVFTAKVSDKVTNLAGIDKLEGFNIKEFFEDVLQLMRLKNILRLVQNQQHQILTMLIQTGLGPGSFSKHLSGQLLFTFYLFKLGKNFKT